MARRPKEEVIEERKILNLFNKQQLIQEIIYLRRDKRRQHTMLKTLYANKKNQK